MQLQAVGADAAVRQIDPPGAPVAQQLGGGEEFLALEGTFSDEHGDCPIGRRPGARVQLDGAGQVELNLEAPWRGT